VDARVPREDGDFVFVTLGMPNLPGTGMPAWLQPGERVRVADGVLAGLEGVVRSTSGIVLSSVNSPAIQAGLLLAPECPKQAMTVEVTCSGAKWAKETDHVNSVPLLEQDVWRDLDCGPRRL
jgi:hypothetical protein